MYIQNVLVNSMLKLPKCCLSTSSALCKCIRRPVILPPHARGDDVDVCWCHPSTCLLLPTGHPLEVSLGGWCPASHAVFPRLWADTITGNALTMLHLPGCSDDLSILASAAMFDLRSIHMITFVPVTAIAQCIDSLHAGSRLAHIEASIVEPHPLSHQYVESPCSTTQKCARISNAMGSCFPRSTMYFPGTLTDHNTAKLGLGQPPWSLSIIISSWSIV